jgi:prepilin-type N-terminal cleavage/methylation domain-containing protein
MRIGRNNKNSGFSLVELIIVIAIMAIVVTVAGLSVGTLTGRRVRKCADEIVSTIERARVLTLGKEQNNVECVISYDSTDKEYHAMVYQVINGTPTEVSDRVVGRDPIQVQVYFDDDTHAYSLTELKGALPYASSTQGLHLVFNRASGAFEAGTCEAGGAKKNFCKRIVVSNSDGTRRIEITTVGRTGKIVTK